MKEYRWNDIKIGLTESFEVNITKKMVEDFCTLTGDINPLHINENYAKSKGFEDRVIYGMLTASFLSTLGGKYLPGKYCLIHEVNVLFKKTVFLSDSPLVIEGKVIDINEIFKQFTIKFEIKNNKNEKVSRGTMKVGVLDE